MCFTVELSRQLNNDISGSDSNPNGYVWMSTATFSSKGTIVVPWSTPVRLTGAEVMMVQMVVILSLYISLL